MAIRIPSANISTRKSAKILRNKINSVAYTENNLVGSIESAFSSSFSIYSSTGNNSNNINDYTNNILANVYIPKVTDTYNIDTTYEYHYVYFAITNIKYPSLTKKENLSMSIQRKRITSGATLDYNEKIVVGKGNYEYSFNKYENVLSFEEETFALGSNQQIGIIKDFTGFVKAGVVLRDYDFDILLLLKIYEKNNSDDTYYNIQQSYNISFALKLYKKASQKWGVDNADFTLEGNELLSSSSKIATTSIGESLSNKIIEAYSNGKQIATIACSMNDYYDYDSGEKVIGVNSPQLLDSDSYSKLYNAEYNNGVVSQISPDEDTQLPSPLFNIANATFVDGNIPYYYIVYGNEMLQNLKEGDKVRINYTFNGNKYSYDDCSVTVDRVGIRALAIPEELGFFLPLIQDDNGTMVGVIYLNYDASQDFGSDEVGGVLGGSTIVVIKTGGYSNEEVGFQIDNISASTYLFQIQGYKDDNVVVDTLNSARISKNQRISLRFYKDERFDQLRFKLNGVNRDTGILFDVSSLENGKTYCFSANVNIEGGQGNISWSEMQISYGARPKPYDKYVPMTFQQYDKVIPMVMNWDGKDRPMSVNPDGNPKEFIVLGVRMLYDGEVLQELSLQEC